MLSCSEFLEDYSEYRDGVLELRRRIAFDAHLAACPSCSRYDAVVTGGVGELKALPALEPSSDFLDRLQHRLYSLEQETAWWARRDASGTSVGFVLLLVVLIGAAAWLPLMRSQPPVIELPPVAAAPPPRQVPIHSLFRSGPLLAPTPAPAALGTPSVNTLFFQYSPLGSNVVRYSSQAGPR
jgi:hypothetical protein